VQSYQYPCLPCLSTKDFVAQQRKRAKQGVCCWRMILQNLVHGCPHTNMMFNTSPHFSPLHSESLYLEIILQLISNKGNTTEQQASHLQQLYPHTKLVQPVFRSQIDGMAGPPTWSSTEA